MARAPDVFDLARLVGPTSPGKFFAEYWDRQPLHVRRDDRRYFETLFAEDDLVPLLRDYGAPGTHDLRLVKRDGAPGTVLLPAGVPPRLDALFAAYRDGYTLNVNDVASRHAGLRRMTHAMLGDMGARPRPNLFLTPPGSRAFDLHFDSHDVMIVQLGGAKEWRVYGRVEENPTGKHSDGASVPREAVGAPLVDTVLEAGDVLYVPRGFVHEAYTAAAHSLHVTIGLRMGTYLDLLAWMTEVVGFDSTKIRASLPPGALFGRSLAETKAQMLALLTSEVGDSIIDRAMATWAASELAGMTPVDAPALGAEAFSIAAAERPITLDEPLVKAEGLVGVVSTGEGRARLHFQAGTFEGPWKISPALEHVARAATIRASELPGVLRDEERVLLVTRLVREGVLRRDGR